MKKSIFVLSIVFLLSIFFTFGYTVYYADINSTNLYLFDTDTSTNLLSYNALDKPMSICTNSYGTQGLVAQGETYLSPKINKFFENSIFYDYNPIAQNGYCNIKNGIILLDSIYQRPSLAVVHNVSIWNSNNNDYKIVDTNLNGALRYSMCQNSDGSIIVLPDGNSYIHLNIYRNFVNSSIPEIFNISITANTFHCDIINGELYFSIGNNLYKSNITSLSSNYTGIFLYNFTTTISNILIKNNILFVSTKYNISYDDISDNTFTPLNYSIGCSNQNTLQCFSVTDDAKGLAIINNNTGTVWLSINSGAFYDSNLSATSVAISGSTSNVTTPLCIDNNTLCNNPFGIYCNVADTQTCSNGCINTLIGGITTGACNTSLCTDECIVIGYQECSDTTTFMICGNYDTDNCLEYNDGYGCVSGNICSSGYCISNTGVGLTGNTAFTIIPYSISDESTIYTLDTLNKKVTIDTKNYAQIQKFSINTNDNTTYSARTCNYKDSLQFTSNVQEVINTSKSVVLGGLNSASQVKVSLLPQDLINVTLTIKDSITNNINQLLFTRNSTRKELCVYENNTLIYCDYSVNNYDDLTSIDVTFIYEFQSKTYTSTILFNRAQDYQVSIQPHQFTQNDVYEIVINSTNATYLNSSSYYISQPNGFATTLRGNYDFLPCTYSETGCYIARTYNNNNGLTDYTNYYDYNVCINSLSNNNPSVSSKGGSNFGSNLSAIAKIFIALFVMVVLIAGLLVAGSSVGNAGLGFIVGVVLSAFAMVGFTIAGWIPVWVLVMLIVLCLASLFLIPLFKPTATG